MYYPVMQLTCTIGEDLFIYFKNEENSLDDKIGPFGDMWSAEEYVKILKYCAENGVLARKEEDETSNP